MPNSERFKPKVVGEPDEGKPHVRFEVAGDEDQDRAQVLRHSHRKRRVNRSTSPKSQASFPDPTTRLATSGFIEPFLAGEVLVKCEYCCPLASG